MNEELVDSEPPPRRRPWLLWPGLVVLVVIGVSILMLARISRTAHAGSSLPPAMKAEEISDAVPAIHEHAGVLTALSTSPPDCSLGAFFCVNSDSTDPAQTLRKLSAALPTSTVKRYEVHLSIEAIPDQD